MHKHKMLSCCWHALAELLSRLLDQARAKTVITILAQRSNNLHEKMLYSLQDPETHRKEASGTPFHPISLDGCQGCRSPLLPSMLQHMNQSAEWHLASKLSWPGSCCPRALTSCCICQMQSPLASAALIQAPQALAPTCQCL